MTKRTSTTAVLLALLSSACSDDGTNAQPTPSGTGGASGTGGSAGADAAAGSAGQDAAPDSGSAACFGTESTDEKFSQAMQVLRDALKKDSIPGGAIAVVKDGKVVNVGVAGSKKANSCDPITPDSLFPTGYAATPLITSIAALDAVEEGKLSLTGPITDVIPKLSVTNGDASKITLQHLLTASSNYWAESLSTGTQGSACMDSLAEAFTNATNPILKAPPGSMPDNLFLNFELAGLALENADGKPYVDAVTDRVLRPLTMVGTFDSGTAAAGDYAGGYFGTAEVPAPESCLNTNPSIGYFGSIRDMAKLAEYLTGGQGSILEQASLDAMVSNQGPFFVSSMWVGYGGVGMTNPDLGGDMIFQNNSGGGFTAEVRVYKQRRLALVALINSGSNGIVWPTGVVNDAVARIYDPSLKPFWEKPFFDPAFTPDPASLPSLVGMYQDDLGFKGTGPRTIDVVLDPANPEKLAGTVSASGTSDAVTFAGSGWADNFTVTLGTRSSPATNLGREVRFWRDSAGTGSAIQLYGDNGPPFNRVP